MLGIGTLYIYIFYFINKQTKKKFKRSMFYDKISFYRHYNQDSRMLINLPEITVCILPLCFDEEGQNRNRPITIKCLQHIFFLISQHMLFFIFHSFFQQTSRIHIINVHRLMPFFCIDVF